MPKQRSRSPNPEPFTVADAHTIIEAVQRLGNAPLLSYASLLACAGQSQCANLVPASRLKPRPWSTWLSRFLEPTTSPLPHRPYFPRAELSVVQHSSKCGSIPPVHRCVKDFYASGLS
jgi:hypothetical protein